MMNLSELFIKAHALARKVLVKFSGVYRDAFRWALKATWENERFVCPWQGISTLRETEKAFRIAVCSADINDRIFWIPKSLCEVDETPEGNYVYGIKNWFWLKNK